MFCNSPISIVENELYRKCTNLEPKTIRKHIVMLADIVGFLVKDAFGKGKCIADGWSAGGVHYNAVYHKWPVRDENGATWNRKALLSIQPLLNETDLGAESIAESIAATYDMYSADGVGLDEVLSEAVVAYTLDNCSVNSCSIRAVSGVMIGAYCHHLNLAATHWTKDAFDGRLQTCLDHIHAVMIRASTLKVGAEVRKYTDRKPTIRNKTRWMEIKTWPSPMVTCMSPLQPLVNLQAS